MKTLKYILIFVFVSSIFHQIYAQENDKLILSGKFISDQRILLNDENPWVWNENRLSINLDKKITDKSKFSTDIWLRNFGLPEYYSAYSLYNKGILDPYDIEIREAYVKVTGFLLKNLDMTLGRQRIAWGTADKLNPTDNLNPYDLEDILDFGRHRGSDALRLQYYLSDKFSVEAVYLPFFQPANLPVGIFSDVLSQPFSLPEGMTLVNLNDSLIKPSYNIAESSVAGFKFKGFAAGFDFSLSYVWGRDGLPYTSYNTFIPANMFGGVQINTQLSFARQHIFGIDLAGNLGGIGIWAEAAAYLPDSDVHMINNLSAMYPMSPVQVIQDSIILEKKMYFKGVVGADYFFANGSYLNFQYLHGFIHEQGNENLNDYFFLNYELKFFNQKLVVRPISGGFIISDWGDIGKNYSLVYLPGMSYNATENFELAVNAAIFDGKGNNIFSGFSEKNMLMLKATYSF